MKRIDRRWFISLACMAILVISACGSQGSDEFEVDSSDSSSTVSTPNSAQETGDWGQCTSEDMSRCRAGAVCMSGMCLGGLSNGGGGGECTSSYDCLFVGQICSHGVCM